MRVLLVHNYYGSSAPSGENLAYDCDVELLRERGHDVIQFTVHSDDLLADPVIGRVRGAFTCVWNPLANARLRALIHAVRPDIMHAHNVFPRLSPSIFKAADRTDTATVLTLHNYRIFCAAGTAMRAGAACSLCGDSRSVMPALRYRCYRDAFAATVPVAASIALHRSLRTLDRHVDAFIALTRFQQDFFLSRGLIPGDRVHVRPNFMPGTPQAMDWSERDPKVAYVGRLSEDKGVDVLVEAWKLWGSQAPPLVVVGDGPRRAALERSAKQQIKAGQIRVTGKLSAATAHAVLRTARMVVIPSRAFEGFPMVIREALAFGVPIVASEIGALASIVADSGCGVAFPVGDAAALAREARALWNDPQRLHRMSVTAVEVYRNLYSEDAAYAALLKVYTAAMARRQTADTSGIGWGAGSA